MRPSTPRRAVARLTAVLALALAMATGTTGLVAGPAAHAQPVTEGTFAFSGDEGDWVSGGQSYAYSTASQDRLTITGSEDHRTVSVAVDGVNGDWWHLDFSAPTGKALAPGTYTDATRHPFNEAGPGLSLGGNGRGCNTLTGTFTIAALEFGPQGYVKSFDATFEQHCEGGTTAARGEIHVNNPAPPAELGLGLAVALDGTANALNGKAVLHGTVSCDKPVRVDVTGDVTQVKKRKIIRGSYATSVACAPGAPVAWTAAAVPSGDVPFQRGDVEVEARASATDPDYDRTVTVAETVAVHLRKG
ncbi:hypothetical protein [Streptomyces ficellus]|uniref:Uncharacterized protein n=1 Tax=Streptomyces ficellus TaxID=1977088 RepID=A0A6I6FQ09_9ACTN|nr:hypothetical protein [Streptomyces ficellus]QGV78616.1 hypothetical protein EIZ62_10440 [Streptomyces ficellus]